MLTAMAAETNARQGKHSSISFTLPISCQVCLGKVKNPVLCPNDHVFCSNCMEAWLEKNSNCPTCRTAINKGTQRVRQIRGGLEYTDAQEEQQSNPDLRRTRFMLLYKEYEDEISKLKREVSLLQTENEILQGKVRATSDRGLAASVSRQSTSSDSDKMLALTKKMQDSQKSLDKMKTEAKRLSRENDQLKDENVSLSIENDRVRKELANRSPQRYGRYTVAALEKELEGCKKENRQLKQALEKSDAFIEGLQKELDNCQCQVQRKPTELTPVSTSTTCTSSTLHTTAASVSSSTSYLPESRVVSKPLADGHSVKRQLFTGKQKQQQDIRTRRPQLCQLLQSDEEEATSSGGLKRSHSDDLAQTRSTSRMGSQPPRKLNGASMRREFKEKSSGDFSGNAITGHNGARGHPSDTDVTSEKWQSPKKVTFDLPRVTNDSASSFDLEAPSPMTPATPETLGQGGKSQGRKSVPSGLAEKLIQAQKLLDQGSPIDLDLPSSASATGALDSSDFLEAPGDSYKQAQRSGSSKNTQDDDSRLSEPDVGPSGGGVPSSRVQDDSDFDMSLDDTQTIQNELDDLNISLTPELSDCLKLLNRAEKKVHSVVTSHAPSIAPAPSVTSNPSGMLTSRPPCPPLPSDAWSGWQHQYYSSLGSNLYRADSAPPVMMSSQNSTKAPPLVSYPDFLSSTAGHAGSSSGMSNPAPTLSEFGQSKSQVGSMHARVSGAGMLPFGDVGLSVGLPRPMSISQPYPSQVNHRPGSTPPVFSESLLGASRPPRPHTRSASFSSSLPVTSHKASFELSYASLFGKSHQPTSQSGLGANHGFSLSSTGSTQGPRYSSSSSSSTLTTASNLASSSHGLASLAPGRSGGHSLPPASSVSLGLLPHGSSSRVASSIGASFPGPSYLGQTISSAAVGSYSSSLGGMSTYGRGGGDGLGSGGRGLSGGTSSNYSYFSNTSSANDFSRNGDTIFPEPKKRLFQNDSDVELALSPIKTTRTK